MLCVGGQARRPAHLYLVEEKKVNLSRPRPDWAALFQWYWYLISLLMAPVSFNDACVKGTGAENMRIFRLLAWACDQKTLAAKTWNLAHLLSSGESR